MCRKFHIRVAGYGWISGKGEGCHHRAGRHRRRLDRPPSDRARLGRHRRHRQVRNPHRHRFHGACVRLLLHDRPRLPVLLDVALLALLLRQARPLRAHRRPGSGARRRRRAHGRDQAQGRLGQGLRYQGQAHRTGRDQGEVPADRRRQGAGRALGSGRRPRHPAFADRRRQAGRPGRRGRQAAGFRQHAGNRAEDRGRPHPGRGHRARHHRGRLCDRLRGPLGPADRGDGRRGPAGHAGRPSADVLRPVHGVCRNRQGDRLSAAARPGQLGLHARYGRSDHLRRWHDRVGLLRGEGAAALPPARPAREAPGAPVALAARPRHGTDHGTSGARHRADADPRRTRLRRAALLQRPASGDRRRRPVDRREPEGEGAVVRRRHLGQGRAGHGQARRRLDDRRTHGDRPRPDRLFALLSAPDEGGLHRRALRRGGAEDLQSGGPPARALRDRPQRAAFAVLRAREGTRRPFHGTRRLGARPRLRCQRASPGKIRRPRTGARQRVGQPPFLARLQRRAPRHERGLRHRQPVAFLHVRRGRPRPRCADGMAVRGEDRRRRQYRQGHLYALPRRRGHGARRPDRHPHGRPLPRHRRRRRRPARFPLRQADRRGQGLRRDGDRRHREVRHHRNLGS